MKHYYLSLPAGYEVYDGNGNHLASCDSADIAETIVSSLNYDDGGMFDALTEIMGLTEIDATIKDDAEKLNEILLDISNVANLALMEAY